MGSLERYPFQIATIRSMCLILILNSRLRTWATSFIVIFRIKGRVVLRGWVEFLKNSGKSFVAKPSEIVGDHLVTIIYIEP